MPEMPMRCGWFAATRGVENRHWLYPGEASDLVEVPTVTLRNWANEGVISYIQMNPKEHRRYSREELQELVNVLGTGPTLWMIRDYIAAQLVDGR